MFITELIDSFQIVLQKSLWEIPSSFQSEKYSNVLGGVISQLVKCLPHRQECLSSICRTHFKVKGIVTCTWIPVLMGRCRQVDPWGWIATVAQSTSKVLDQWEPLSEKTEQHSNWGGELLRNGGWFCPPVSICLCTHMYLNQHRHSCTDTSKKEKEECNNALNVFHKLGIVIWMRMSPTGSNV